MYEEKNTFEQLEENELEAGMENAVEQPQAGIDYSKDFIWGSNQDEYIDES